MADTVADIQAKQLARQIKQAQVDGIQWPEKAELTYVEGRCRINGREGHDAYHHPRHHKVLVCANCGDVVEGVLPPKAEKKSKKGEEEEA